MTKKKSKNSHTQGSARAKRQVSTAVKNSSQRIGKKQKMTSLASKHPARPGKKVGQPSGLQRQDSQGTISASLNPDTSVAKNKKRSTIQVSAHEIETQRLQTYDGGNRWDGMGRGPSQDLAYNNEDEDEVLPSKSPETNRALLDELSDGSPGYGNPGDDERGAESTRPSRKASSEITDFRKELKVVKKQYCKLEEKIDSLHGDMRNVMQKMNVILSRTMTAESQKQVMSSPKSQMATTKRKYEDLMEAQLVHLRVAFSEETVAPCIYNTVISMILTDAGDGDLTVYALNKILSTVVFALKKTDKKEVYRTRSGSLASRFRQKVMIRVLKTAQSNTLQVFDSENSESQNHTPHQLEHPTWLRKVCADGSTYISSAMIVEAQRSMEMRNEHRNATYERSLKIVNGTIKPGRRDIGVYAMRYLYSTMLKTFSKGRKSAPRQFFETIGYLFLEWSSYQKCLVRDSSVLVVEMGNKDGHTGVFSRTDVPSTLNFTDEPNEENRRGTNKQRFKSFCQDRTELCLISEHDVYVRTRTKKTSFRSHKGDERRRWRRVISLLDVASHFISGLCGFDRNDDVLDILSFHKKSITALYLVAKVIKQVIMNRNERSITRSTDSSHYAEGDSRTSISEQEAQALDSLFKYFQLTGSPVEQVLVRCTCAIPEEIYLAEHVHEDENVIEQHREVEELDELPEEYAENGSEDYAEFHMDDGHAESVQENSDFEM